MDGAGPNWVSEAAVEALLEPVLLVSRLEQAFCDLEAGRLIELRPARIDDTALASNFVSFHAYWPAAGLSTTKVLVGAERNPRSGQPMIDAVIVAIDAANGRIAAILSARHVTAMRTAATTFIAFRHMGLKPGASVGLIGTGVQMRAHALVASALGFTRSYIASADGDADRARIHAERLVRETGMTIEVLPARDVVSVADAVVLSTIAQEPFIPAECFRSDGLVASVGAFLPHAAELDPNIVAEAAIVVSDYRVRLQDQWRGAKERLGRAYDDVLDLPRLVTGTETALRPAGSRGVFLSDGRSLEDLAAVSIILQRQQSN